MTIKRRLFISNILMIVLPMILIIVMGLTLFFAIIGITGTDLYSLGSEKVTYVDDNKAHELLLNDEYTFVSDDISIYKSNTGSYMVVLPKDVTIRNEDAINEKGYITLLIFILLLVIVFLTNRALTRFVFRSVVTPIDILVNGVHEIRDGNLSYRIQYDKNDEFTAICSDMNEMADHLEEMVNVRQQDEINRRELIAGISHDLRTPLTSIKAYLEGLEKGVASTPETQKRYLDIIKGETNDLEYIINQLFLFSQLDAREFPFHLEQTDIGNEVSKLIDSHENEYSEKGLTISLAKNVKNVYAAIDVVQFRNVIYNILGNSVKYKDKEHVESKIVCRENDANVIIRLEDNGSGVPEESIDKLFDIFYRSDIARSDPNNGSGLGLAISKKIIERLGGEIHAENIPGGGLAIEITIPKCGRKENEKNTDY